MEDRKMIIRLQLKNHKKADGLYLRRNTIL